MHDKVLRGSKDIVPDGFEVERSLAFKYDAKYEYKNHQNEDGRVLLRLKRDKILRTIRFKTKFNSADNKMTYAVKAGMAAQYDHWYNSSGEAWAFLKASGRTSLLNFSGPRIFGFQCDAVQQQLSALRAQDESNDVVMTQTSS